MPEISQQDTDIMNNLAHGRRILYYTEDIYNKSKHRQCGVKPSDLRCLVLLTRYLSLSHIIDKLDSHP